jgi:hypothetical protein
MQCNEHHHDGYNSDQSGGCKPDFGARLGVRNTPSEVTPALIGEPGHDLTAAKAKLGIVDEGLGGVAAREKRPQRRVWPLQA